MRALWKTASLIAIPVAYCVAFSVFVAYALSNGVDDLTVACILTLLTAAGVRSWYKIGISAMPGQGQRFAAVSGAWVGVVLMLFAAYAYLHMFYGHPWQFSD